MELAIVGYLAIYYEENFCEILNLDQLFRGRCHLKTFLIYSSGNPFFFGRVEPFVQFW